MTKITISNQSHKSYPDFPIIVNRLNLYVPIYKYNYFTITIFELFSQYNSSQNGQPAICYVTHYMYIRSRRHNVEHIYESWLWSSCDLFHKIKIWCVSILYLLFIFHITIQQLSQLWKRLIDWFFTVLRPAQQFFTNIETSPLPEEGYKI
jgi:hypothetical protein